MKIEPKNFLRKLFDIAVAAAHPDQVFEQNLPEDKTSTLVVIGAGKAAASMASALEKCWQGSISGLVVTPYGHGVTCKHIEVIEAAHPVPDEAGEQIAKKILALANKLTEQDKVFCLISGGGSSLLALPAKGVSLVEKKQINKALLRSGATIFEMNCVRKHLSAIKGGRLAQAFRPAKCHTFVISDVPGDVIDVVASGPTVADPSTSAEALDILKRYQIEVSESVVNWLNSPESETLKTYNKAFNDNKVTLLATAQQSLEAAATYATAVGITPLILSDCIEGESREVAKVHAAIAKQARQYGQPIKPPCVILSGGETSVTVKGNGRGGRNAEFLLSLLANLGQHLNIYALAADTDGIDGCEKNAGAYITPETFDIVRKKGLNPDKYLINNDGFSFFSQIDQLIMTGPTKTNVNDFRAILIC
ncbi:glycerate kinase [Colwelliaceae bacterium 6441]